MPMKVKINTQMTCPKCQSTNIEFNIQVFMKFPGEYYLNITKKHIRDKRVKLLAADWSGRPKFEGIRFHCKDCQHGWKY